MAEPFKNLISLASVTRLAEDLARADRSFDRDGFVAAATPGLDALELKARVRHVGERLRPFLAPAWPDLLDQLVAATPPAEPNHEGVTAHFYWWPALDLVERQGLSHVDRSLVALSRLTATFSAEFAVRPYLAQAPEPTWRALAGWVDHPDHHVRRWVSEGSRPRLPWGARLPTGDPSRGLALLDRLVDDPSPFVRRSVANHLGDVAKDHPERAVEVARGWWVAPRRRPTVEHGLRSLLKAGHAGALAVVGVASGGVTAEGVTVTPAVAEVGGTVTLTATVRAGAPGPVRVDVVWAWPGARGGWSQRVFRGDTRTLGEGEAWAFTHRLSLRPVTTRPLRPGTQRLTLRANGADVATGVFLMKTNASE